MVIWLGVHLHKLKVFHSSRRRRLLLIRQMRFSSQALPTPAPEFPSISICALISAGKQWSGFNAIISTEWKTWTRKFISIYLHEDGNRRVPIKGNYQGCPFAGWMLAIRPYAWQRLVPRRNFLIFINLLRREKSLSSSSATVFWDLCGRINSTIDKSPSISFVSPN